MRAVVLAGGYASRLRPLTLRRPAGILSVAGRPILEYVLEHLAQYKVSDAAVALHHGAALVEPILGDGARWGLRVQYALERVPLGTAGAARRVAAGWREPFVLASSTALITTDLSKAVAFHNEQGATLTLVCAGADGCLDLGLDDRGQLVALPSVAGSLAWLGYTLVDPRVFALVGPGERCDLIEDLLPRVRRAGGVVRAYQSAEPGLLIRTPRDLMTANRLAISGGLPDLALPGFEVSPGIRLCRGARIHPTAHFAPPVLIGANAVVGRASTVESSGIGEEEIVGPRSTIRGSVILARTHVGPGLQLCEAIAERRILGQVAGGPWVTVDDGRLLGDTRESARWVPAGLPARAAAAVLLGLTAIGWLPCLAGLAVETAGRPFRSRMVMGARGRPAWLRRVRVRGPVGRTVERLGLTRVPYVWSVLRGDLHWVGTTPRTVTQTLTLLERGAETAVSRPGLVTLAHVAPFVAAWHDRLALDRVYAATRTAVRDLRLLGGMLRRRVSRPLGSEASRPSA
jgi:NDP-sugar pyrophosphorylase family protein